MASQMSDAKYETTTVTLEVTAGGRTAEFTASGTVYTFQGFLEAYEEGRDEKRSDADKSDDQSLPALAVGDVLRLKDVEPKGHATSPKPRYTEASLVKALEEKGIGRPSTFASIIDVILEPRLRHQARPGADPELARVQRRAPARGALRRPRRLRLHRGARGRPRRDRPRRAEARGLAEGLLLRLRRPGRACATSSTTSARSTPARSTRRRSATSRRSGSASTAPISRSPTRRIRRPSRAASTSPRTSHPTSSRPPRRRSSSTPRSPAIACSARTPRTASSSS